ncbi:Tetratricopeptide TPR_2 repeat protein [Denitrovibrio acetiphilus DSM 12809]|uniref:Tetratricopeptide TPR_2 repeat protein n=2 Tax=Denitrovibrio TaxID=117999 RepID=D4H2X0_DENA2|nr:Tetratricopeptide TPR_2 repeat protein [Denitrovibrio acetiphilus DSM 12809]
MRRFMFLLIVLFAVSGCVKDTAAYLDASKAAMNAPTHKEAVAQYESGVTKSVHSHYYYEGLGDIHYAYGYYGEAVNDYTRALRNDGRPEYNLKRGRAYMKLSFFRDAIIDFTSVIDLAGSKMPVAYVERAKAYAAKGDYKEAMDDLDKAVSKGGESAEFLIAMGELYFKMGEYGNAKAYVQRALMKDGESSELYLLRGKIFYKSKDANQSIADLKKAIELDRSNLEAKRMLAWIYATNPISGYRNGAEALNLAKSLFNMNQDVQCIEVLAAAYAELGDFDNAVRTLEEGIRLSDDLVQQEDFRFDIKNYKKGEPLRIW